MDWRIKCAVQHVFSVVPGGRRLNYWMQRHVQRSIPVSDRKLQECRSAAEAHLAAFQGATGRRPLEVFEFGSGQCLGVPIVLGLRGCRVFATDIAQNAEPDVVMDAARRLGAESLAAASVTYRAPYRPDMAADASFDMVMSTSVLEHVPPSQLDGLLQDCRRILKPDGVCSFLIDYQDHWANFDKSISVHNFLRFGRSWPLFNPALQYQNRLRHSDYLKAFERAKLRAVSVKAFTAAPPAFPLAPQFRKYGPDDITTTGAHFVLAR